MHRTLRILILICFTTLFLGNSKQAIGRRAPKWVKERPVNREYYTGIALAKKGPAGTDYMQAAKNKALSDLCSEISVTISSNSVLQQFENNYEFTEEFEANTRTSLLQSLEGYELVGTWYNKKTHEYWVYYRLSKEKHKLLKLLKLNKAKKLSQTFMEQARKSEKQLDLFQALNYYAKALDAIKDHLDEDLSVMSLEGSFNLGSAIYNSIQNIFKRTQLTPEFESVQIEISTAVKDPIQTKATWQGDRDDLAIAGLPLKFRFAKGAGIMNEKVATNENGIAASYLTKVTSKQKLQEIEVSLDLEAFLSPENELHQLNRLFFTPESAPSSKIILNVERLIAFMEFQENIFGEPSKTHILENNFKKEMSENFFSFTNKPEKADVILNIRTNVTKGEIKEGRNYKVYIVYLDCFISLIDPKTQQEIFADTFQEVRGMKPISYDYAIKEAYEEALHEIHNNIIPKLNKLDL